VASYATLVSEVKDIIRDWQADVLKTTKTAVSVCGLDANACGPVP
jgi:hypothetical protein